MTLKEFCDKTFSPLVWVNLLGILLTVIIIGFATLWWMDIYTRHGESIDVPDLTNTTLPEAEQKLGDLGLQGYVLDSIYNTHLEQGTVLEQSPAAGTTVKEGREIMLTISTRHAPTQAIPNIINNCSYREAESKLRAIGFKIGNIEYTSGDKDWVYGVKQRGTSVFAGQKVDTSIPLTLVIGGNSTMETDEDGSIYEGLDSTYNTSSEESIEEEIFF